jgi:TolB-like protein
MCLTSFLSKVFCAILAFSLAGCFGGAARTESDPIMATKRARIAVLPLENLSGAAAPLKNIRAAFIERLEKQSITVLSEESLNLFMDRNRMRYTGGLTPELARALKTETGVEAALVTSLELYDETAPPKFSISSRLVSLNDPPEILWADSGGLAGDDNPGILAIGVIDDPVVLRNKVLTGLTKSLMSYLEQGEQGRERIRLFKPNALYRSRSIHLDNKTQTIMVVPFLNESERANAGEILALLFVEQLKKSQRFKVIQPGLVREGLLSLRIIMEGGLSLSNADALFSALEADYVITGKVFTYQDYRGGVGTPKVGFNAIVLEKKSRRVVWSSDSYREGNSGVYVFDFGQINNAHAMASNMVGTIIRMMAQ